MGHARGWVWALAILSGSGIGACKSETTASSDKLSGASLYADFGAKSVAPDVLEYAP
jgi:hypothetical protein